MTDKQVLIREIETLPPQIIAEVFDYVSFLKLRNIQDRRMADITLASEKSLAKEWLLPEEDSTWANL